MKKPETHITRQARRLSKGQIDRRRFVMSALASGVTMPTAMSLASRAEAARPKPGGHLRFGVSSIVEMQRQIDRVVASPLVRIAPNGDVIGELAESFEHDATGRIWRFALRSDVRFHSGRPLATQDVVASLKAAAQKVPGIHGVIRQISNIETDGRAVVLTLHRPHRDFARLLADPVFAVEPAGAATEELRTRDGTGPYRLRERGLDGTAYLERNPDHWSSGRGHFDTIEIRPLPDPRLRQSAIMTGEVDVVDGVDPRALAMLSSLPGVCIAETEGHGHLALDVIRHDPLMKEALRAAIDRERLLERGFLGHGAIGDDAPLRSATQVHAFDPDRARDLLRRGGIETASLAVEVGRFECADTLLALINATTRDLGLTLRPSATGEVADLRLHHEAGFGLQDSTYAALHRPDAASSWSDKPAARRFSEQLCKAQSTDDLTIRKHRLTSARALWRQNSHRLIPVWTNDLVAHSARLARMPGSGNAEILERWWFA